MNLDAMKNERDDGESNNSLAKIIFHLSLFSLMP